MKMVGIFSFNFSYFYNKILLGGEKVRINRIISLILITCILLSLFTFVNADDRSYKIENYHINARIDENGDMLVDETLDYVFDGAFNGIYRTLSTDKDEEYENIQVYALENGQLIGFVNNNSEKLNTFQLINEGKQLKIKAFSKSIDERKTFVIKYKVNKAATKYKDTAELYWQFTGKNSMEVQVDKYNVLIWLPKNVQKDNIRAFAHGPLSGKVGINPEGSVYLAIAKLKPKNMVEARILFPTETLNQNARYVDKMAYNKIMAEEANEAEKANKIRVAARIFIGLAYVLALFQLLLIIYIYYRYDKEFKADFQGIYFRELPYEYSPAVLAVLWNFGNVTPKEITATLMDLVRRKVLSLKVESSETHGLLGTKTDKSYTFIKQEEDRAKINQHERYLIDWLIDDIGNGVEINLDELKGYTKTAKNAEKFKKSYDEWVELIKAEAESYQFLDKGTAAGIALGVISAIIGIGYGIYTLIAHENISGFALLLLTSIILIIYSSLVKRRSKTGVEHFNKWKAFRKYLTDFSMLKNAEIPAITLWEHYLVYAITLGVAAEVIKQLKVVFRDEDFRHSGLTYMYYGYYGHNLNHLDSIDRVTNDIIKTTESTYTQAMSQLSSKGGSGGGFSGGGGGGGGGGGAGAF